MRRMATPKMRLGVASALNTTCFAGHTTLAFCAAGPAPSSVAPAAAALTSASAPLRRLPPPLAAAAPLPASPPHPRAPSAAAATTTSSVSAASAALAAVGSSHRVHRGALVGSPRCAAAARPDCPSPAGGGTSTGEAPAPSHTPSPAAPTPPGADTASSGPEASAPAAPSPSSASSPQLPLCRRPAVHLDELGAALAWKAAMADRIQQLGDSLEQQDGGPDAAGLMRELDWVLDDVIEAVRERPDAPWEGTSWRLLEPRAKAEAHRQRTTDPRVTTASSSPASSWQLRLREPLGQLWEWWERRLRDRVPFQYLISSAHWHRYVLSVGPGVLVPRPETEIFPKLVRTAISSRPHLAGAPWADLGTGSGAIAIAAADELRRVNPAAQVWAVDLSPAAVAYAQFNAALCLPPNTHITGPSSQQQPATTSLADADATTGNGSNGQPKKGSLAVHVVQGSWFEPLAHLRGRLGGVLSNPPYIPRVEMGRLQAEVGRHEPLGALDGGEGPGLDSLQELCSQAAAMLTPGGLIALETAGGEQAELVAGLLRAAPDPREGDTDPWVAGPVVTQHSVPEWPSGGMAGSSSGSGGGSGGSAVGVGAAAGAMEKAIAAPIFGSVAAPAFEEVEVLPDCYGVRRFVRAYRRGG